MYTNKNILITGASSGIGLEFTNQMIKNKANLILVARTTSVLEKIKNDNPDIKITIITSDLSVNNSPKEVFEQVSNANISIDFLINNAGWDMGKFY